VTADTFGSGSGGNVELSTVDVALQDGGVIQVDNYGPGDGGKLTVNATGALSMAGESPGDLPYIGGIKAGLYAGSFGDGQGGTIDVSAPAVVIGESGKIELNASFGTSPADAGTLNLQAGTLDMTDGGTIQTDTFSSGNAGTVNIDVDSAQLSGGSNIAATTRGTGSGGTVTVNATDDISISGSNDVGPSGIFTNSFDAGNGGSVSITAGQLTVADGAAIQSAVSGDAATPDTTAGSIAIDVTDLNLSGQGQVSTQSENAASAGSIAITASQQVSISSPDAQVQSGIFSTTTGSGDGGAITLATNALDMDGGAVNVSSNSAGDAGTVSMQLGSLTLRGGAQISTSVAGAGNGGDLTIDTGSRADIRGQSGSSFSSGLYSTTGDAGDGGNISLAADHLEISDQGIITAESIGAGDAGSVTLIVDTLDISSGGQVSTSAFSAGQGGELAVQSGGVIRLNGDGSGLYSSTDGDGAGGNIRAEAKRLELGDKAVITAESSAGGNAGDISLSLDKRLDLRKAAIRTRAESADGGNIRVTATDMVYLVDSEITTSVGTGFGDGGNITIDPEFVILNNSRIVANAFGGDGGNILIVTDNFIASPDSVVDASSEFGLDGTVIIKSPEADLTSALTELPEAFLNVAALLREPCSARRSINRSSFIVRGRSAIPPGPMSPLPVMNNGFNDASARSGISRTGSGRQPPTGAGVTLKGLSGAPFLAASLIECGR
jgi:large exoprotein involved in heme utilization and adhesion